ncbi:MAG TPA: PQQ-binding-like beta-propeller repeat protein [Pyrinomonadaceae bacterium]|nr:PQQ-binding-like beta-propeller repeat protein [Pyrinomonadaceae bacterium]
MTLRWGARPGVSRYRLQLANDATFIDIVFDRVVSGHEYRMNDLAPGRYYWRVASLNAKRGEFSSAGVIVVPANGETKKPSPTPPVVTNQATNTVTSRGGWYAAIGDVTRSIVAHLRRTGSSEIVAVTTEGRIVALEASRGIALWTVRTAQRSPSAQNTQVIAIRARGGADNVLVLAGNTATLIEGASGRQLWQTTLPGNAGAATASGTTTFVVDSSRQKLFVIDNSLGRVISEAALPGRAVGRPATITYSGARAVVVALDDGGLHVFDESGKFTIAANAGSPATTAPLIVRTARGELLLVGTRSGLTALAAEDLRALGRVTLKEDAPRGSLIAQDVDSDGRPEVVMFTERGRVVIVKSDEGRIVWEADARRAESAAFADVNGDRVLDLLMAGREGFAFALSGRDGSVVWKDEMASSISTNHAPATSPRETFAVPSASGVLIIAAEPNRTGLRAIEFPKG